jgi:hypothetical protein
VGLIIGLVTVPLAPLRGVVRLAELIQHEAERQLFDPARIQQELTEIDLLKETGAIEEAEADALEEALLQRLTATGTGQQQTQ